MDTLLVNANVITMNPAQPTAQAIAIVADRIAGIAGEDQLRALANAQTRIVDARGRTVCPGFIDAHCHFSIAALEPVSVDCRKSSIPAIVADVRESTRALAPGQWLRGYGYSEAVLAEGRHPTRQELDDACPNNPLLLIHQSLHRCVANTRALAAGGIGRRTPDPAKGLIQRDKQGEPTGVLYEAAANDVLRMANAAYVEQLGDRVLDLFEQQARLWLSRGITAVHDAAVTPAAKELYRRAQAAGKLPIRVYQMRLGPTLFQAPAGVLDGPITPDNPASPLRERALKVFVDGGGNSLALSYPTASGQRRLGILFYPQEELNDLVSGALAGGWQVVCHAAGNEGIAAALSAYRQARGKLPQGDYRFRLEHVMCVTPELLREAGELGIVATMQTVSTDTLGDQWLAAGIPDDVIKYIPLRSLLAHHIVVAGSSDYPCYPAEPLKAMSLATTRRTAKGAILGRGEAITIEEALAMYTRGGAYASFSERVEGSLAPGKLANLVVLSADPLRTAPERVGEIVVEETWVAGKREFCVDSDGQTRRH